MVEGLPVLVHCTPVLGEVVDQCGDDLLVGQARHVEPGIFDRPLHNVARFLRLLDALRFVGRPTGLADAGHLVAQLIDNHVRGDSLVDLIPNDRPSPLCRPTVVFVGVNLGRQLREHLIGAGGNLISFSKTPLLVEPQDRTGAANRNHLTHLDTQFRVRVDAAQFLQRRHHRPRASAPQLRADALANV